jgi:anti-anti-sigma regulatory factor
VCLDDDTYVLTLEADLDLAAAERIAVALRVLPARRFIVDLSRIAFLDWAGAKRLAQEAAGKPLAIVSDDPRVARILDTLDRSLIVHPLLADALA